MEEVFVFAVKFMIWASIITCGTEVSTNTVGAEAIALRPTPTKFICKIETNNEKWVAAGMIWPVDNFDELPEFK